MNCGKCHNMLTFVPHAGQWWCGYCRYYLQAPPPPEFAENARKANQLVNLSHILGWGGLGMLILGPALAAGLGLGGTLAGILALLGVLSAIGGAVVGQVGRAMQGRVI